MKQKNVGLLRRHGRPAGRLSCVTTLAPTLSYRPELTELLQLVANERVMDSNLKTELGHLRHEDRPRFAVIDEGGHVVGYISGRFKGSLPGIDLPEGEIAAFVSILVIAPENRGDGYGWAATKSFADRARTEESASWIGLRLDETGDIATRQAKFERMGFTFTDLYGAARIQDLIGT